MIGLLLYTSGATLKALGIFVLILALCVVFRALPNLAALSLAAAIAGIVALAIQLVALFAVAAAGAFL